MDSMTSEENLVDVRGLVKIYKPDVRALDGVDLGIRAGQIFAASVSFRKIIE